MPCILERGKFYTFCNGKISEEVNTVTKISVSSPRVQTALDTSLSLLKNVVCDVSCGSMHGNLHFSICLDAAAVYISIGCQYCCYSPWASILYLSTNQSGLFLFQRHMQDKIKRDSIYVWQCL